MWQHSKICTPMLLGIIKIWRQQQFNTETEGNVDKTRNIAGHSFDLLLPPSGELVQSV
jgi:hypothetical protein